MRHGNLVMLVILLGSLLLATSYGSAITEEKTILDSTGDVFDASAIFGLSEEESSEVVTESPYVDIRNIDIIKATYTRDGTTVTVTLQVDGVIEKRGNREQVNFESPTMVIDAVEYGFTVTTSDEMYEITYVNDSCQLMDLDGEQVNLTSSDFRIVNGDTLSVTFTLKSAEETYENLSVSTLYMKLDLTAFEGLENPEELEGVAVFTDIAPNPPLDVSAYVTNIGVVGSTIRFNGTVEPMTGQPPYSYRWDFGDGHTSTERSPTHQYTEAKTYHYTFTVTDGSGATASDSGDIQISERDDGGGGGGNRALWLVGVIVIIAVIGGIVVVWIIRR